MKSAEATICPICKQRCVSEQFTRRDGAGSPSPARAYECNRCGRFTMSKHVELMFKGDIPGAHLVAGYIRETNERGDDQVMITEKNLPEVKKLAPRGVLAKAKRLLRAVERRSDYPGQKVPIPPDNCYPLGYCVNAAELRYLLNYLRDRGLIVQDTTAHSLDVGLTVEGWADVEAQRTANASSTKVFVAMAFNPEMRPVYDEAIKPAIEACGYRPVRIDREQFLGPIADAILAHIRESRFVVVDMTHEKGGMYLEGGYAMGRNLPVIWCCRKDLVEKVHFDTRHYNHLTWEATQGFRDDLEARIRATIGLAPGAEGGAMEGG